jgi:hypothetical protein
MMVLLKIPVIVKTEMNMPCLARIGKTIPLPMAGSPWR